MRWDRMGKVAIMMLKQIMSESEAYGVKVVDADC